jgi:2,3-bisphosphoglycerate-independent phosphoglycerate mutase
MNILPSPVDALIILDGWGINPETRGNAVALAGTPFLDRLEAEFPMSSLTCSGRAVGLPDGIMGNSEVGHMNIGAGRRVLQDLVRIDTAIEDGTFFTNPVLTQLMEQTRDRGKTLHLMGLLSDGGVHSHITHLLALVRMARSLGLPRVSVHPILDGRDTPPNSGIRYVGELEAALGDDPAVSIATLCGRFYAMDRDTRWDRVEKAFRLYTEGLGTSAADAVRAMEAAYADGQTDEFIKPVSLSLPDGRGVVGDGDSLLFFNFRADRAREITRAFTETGFSGFNREKTPALEAFACMTQYDETFPLPVVFGPGHLTGILGEVVSRQGFSQLRIAETEKYAHVTYFFNGGDETVFPGEDRVLIPSPRDVPTYDLKPEMSARKVAEAACERIASGRYRFMVLNFANMDMVGHTGVLEAGIRACETLDDCARRVVEAVWKTGGTAMVTADHGNAEQMIADDGSPHTSHTLNPVRFILAGEAWKGIRLKPGILGDIAPTVLKVMGLDRPEEMTGSPLF